MLQIKLRLCKALSFISIAILTTGVASANSEKFIIKFNEGYLLENKALIKNKLYELTGNSDLNLEKIVNNTYSLNLNKSDDENQSILKQIKSDKNIKYIVKDRIGYFKPVPQTVPTFSFINGNLLNYSLDHSAQWDEFKAPQGVFLESKPNLVDGAWRYSTGSTADNPVIVAVLDTGIEYHDNLTRNIVKNVESTNDFGWNFSANNDDLSDETESYHGTHVAGTIAGHGPNVLGMGTALRVLPVKVCNAEGMFFESNVIKSIYWAIGEPVEGAPVNPYPAKVINMSFGIDEYVGKEADDCSQAVQEAIDYARSKGVVMVVAAGNSNMEYDLGSPAGCTGTIRVASTGPTGVRSYFSNYGHGITIAAPGGDKRFGIAGGILSTVKQGEGLDNSGYDFYQGTSMASPHVAGLAGLLYSINDLTRNYTGQDIEKLLYTTSHDFGISYSSESSCRGKKSCGHGIINANNALEAGLANYDILFSSPTVELLELTPDVNCRNSLVSPSKQQIIKAEGTWILVEDNVTCQNELDFTHPTLSIDTEKREIFAKYNHVVYKLNYQHNQCEQIGYDGVGCFK
jgi:serine protease